MVRIAKMPATSAPNTSSGIISFSPTRAKSGVSVMVLEASGRGGVCGLHLDVDDLPDDQRPDDLGDDGEDAHLLAQLVLPEWLDVVGLGVEHEPEQAERQRDQHHARQPALAGEGLDLTEDPEAL